MQASIFGWELMAVVLRFLNLLRTRMSNSLRYRSRRLYAALMFSHVAAFRILYGLRVRLSEHIGKLSLGYLNGTSTGAIKKTMEQNIEKIEGFIAHTIPDLVNVVATVTVMLVIFFSLNIWLTAVCLAVVC